MNLREENAQLKKRIAELEAEILFLTKTVIDDPFTEAELEDFLSNYSIPDNEYDCWIWTETLTRTGLNPGYGIYEFRGSKKKAHRLSHEHYNGVIPKGYVVDHMCHVPPCGNPKHLRAVTPEVNSTNNVSKNRFRTLTTEIHWSRLLNRWTAWALFEDEKYYSGSHATREEAYDSAIGLFEELYSDYRDIF